LGELKVINISGTYYAKLPYYHKNTFNNDMKKDDIVRIIPEYQDGEQEFEYVLIEDPDGGRVKVMPINSGLEYPPFQVVKIEWLVKVRD